MWPEPLFAIHVAFLLWEWSELSALMKSVVSKLCGHIVLQGLGFPGHLWRLVQLTSHLIKHLHWLFSWFGHHRREHLLPGD